MGLSQQAPRKRNPETIECITSHKQHTNGARTMAKNFSISISLTTYTGDGSVLDCVIYNDANDVDQGIKNFEQVWEFSESWSVKVAVMDGQWFEIDRATHYPE